MNKIKTALSSRFAKVAVIVGTVAGGVGIAGIASATPYLPSTKLTTFAASFSVNVGQIILPVAVAMVGLVVLFWAIRFVFGFLRGHR